MNTKVYVLIDPRDLSIRYVGITTKSLEVRLRGHLRDAKNRPDLNYHKICWIKNLQKDNLIPIIQQISQFQTIEEAKEYEINYISKYKKLYNLTNCTIGGDSVGFNIHSRECILLKSTTRPVDQYNIYGELINSYEMTEDACRDNKFNSASKITMCCRYKRPHAFGYIWRYKGDTLGDISNINPNSLSFRKLVQYSLKGEKLNEFNSYIVAGKLINDKSKGGNIAAACTGKQKTAGGFIWRLEDNFKRSL